MEKPNLPLNQNPQIEPSKKSGPLLVAALGACCGAPLIAAGVVGISTLGIFAGFAAIVVGLYKVLQSKIGFS